MKRGTAKTRRSRRKTGQAIAAPARIPTTAPKTPATICSADTSLSARSVRSTAVSVVRPRMPPST